MIRFRCSCGRLLQAREEDVGETAKCPVCEALMLVPSEEEVMREGVSRTPTAAPEPTRRSGHGWREVDDDPRPRPSGRRRERDRDDGRPSEPEKTSRKASWALVLGVLSSFLFVLGPIVGLAAVILGLMGRREVARSQGQLGGGSAGAAGMVMGLLGLLISGGSTLLVWPSLTSPGESAARRQNNNDLKRLAEGMRSCERSTGQLPEAAIFSVDGRPLLSWRVAILPYIGEEKLYQQFDRNEPWDSQRNLHLVRQMPKVYQLPGRERNDGSTYIQVLVGPNAVFPDPTSPNFGGERPKPTLGDITDGTANTILIVTADKAVPWTKPEDLRYDGVSLPRFSKRFSGGHNVAMADGSVRWIKHSTTNYTLRGLITPNGGEIVRPDDE